MHTHQRVREGLGNIQVSDGLDIFSFRQSTNGVTVAKKESAIGSSKGRRLSVVGSDNITEVGEWLASLSDLAGVADPRIEGLMVTDNSQPHKHLAAVAIRKSAELKDWGDLHEVAGSVMQALSDLLGDNENRLENRPELLAAQHSLDIPLGMSTVLSASHTKERLDVVLDPLQQFDPMPYVQAVQLGQWIVEGEQTLVSRSILS